MSIIPFRIQENNNIINEIFNKYIDLYKNTEFKELFSKFQSYFKDIWECHIYNGSLNYIYLFKKERSNSYLENFNRRIK